MYTWCSCSLVVQMHTLVRHWGVAVSIVLGALLGLPPSTVHAGIRCTPNTARALPKLGFARRLQLILPTNHLTKALSLPTSISIIYTLVWKCHVYIASFPGSLPLRIIHARSTIPARTLKFGEWIFYHVSDVKGLRERFFTRLSRKCEVNAKNRTA